MTETAIAPRVLYPDEPIVGPQIREVGNNPPPDSSTVTRVDASKGFLPRLGRIWRGEAEPKPAPPPVPRIPPAEELATLQAQLPHLEKQLAAAQAILEGDPRPYSTSPQAVRNINNAYREMLAKGVDLAGTPLTDLALLRDVLHTVDLRGTLDTTAARISQLTAQLHVPEAPKGQHRKLIQAAETALRNFGLAYRALREFEGKTGSVGQRHQFHCPRPAYGCNFAQLSEQELRRVGEFGEALPIEAK